LVEVHIALGEAGRTQHGLAVTYPAVHCNVSEERDVPGEFDLVECVFQLHSSGRPWDKSADAVDWVATAVGVPAHFLAVQFGHSAWYAKGPVTVLAPAALGAPGWTVSLVGREGTPIMIGTVGRPLAEGEEFTLPVTDLIVGGVPRDEHDAGA
jgi:hypothetical protein